MSNLTQRLAALTPERRKFLLRQLQTQQENQKISIQPRKRDVRSLPLSFAQERLWFLDQLTPGRAWYVVSSPFHLSGSLKVRALEHGLATIVQRHEILRTTFSSQEGLPIQVIAPHLALQIPVIDLSSLPAAFARDQQIKRLAQQDACHPFDLTRGPLLRIHILRLTSKQMPQEHVLLFTLHHIISDGRWSMDILLRELSVLYQAELEAPPLLLPALPIQYADYALWQREWLQGKDLEGQLAYWRQQLSGAPERGLELPTDRPRKAEQTDAGAKLSLLLSPPLQQALQELSQREGVTLFMTLLAAFQVLLMRYSGETDVIVGTPIADRGQAGKGQVPALQDLIGFFVNTLVLRSDLSGNPSFRQLLARVREVALQAYAHQDLPFEKLVDSLKVERSLSHAPLFQILFALQNAPSPDIKLTGLTFRQIEIEHSTTLFDLSLVVTPVERGLLTEAEYSTDLFNAATITRMLSHWQVLLEAIVRDPEQRIGTLPLLTPQEHEQLLVEWNATSNGATGIQYDHRGLNPQCEQDMCVHQLFEYQVEQTPDSAALAFGEDEELTYAELNRRANQLAHCLRKMGIGPDKLVGVCMERSLELVVALLAILKAGGAYLPLDPAYPAERLAWILADAQPSVVLTQSRFLAHLPDRRQLTICLDTQNRVGIASAQGTGQGLALSAVPTEDHLTNPLNITLGGHTAYVIYTSGSTGRPKGVVVSHQNVMNFFQGMDEHIGRPIPGIWLAVTSISFDISVLELFWTLTRGFRVIVHPGEASRAVAQPRHFERLIPPPRAEKDMAFSLFYFASDAGEKTAERYQLLLEGARFADQHGFQALWTPERHFHAFGGLYPNPSVTSAAVAAVTQHIQIRAGSVVLPLHNPIRVAEEWAVVDNLSHGRVGIAFASGWHANDFVFAPDKYAERRELLQRNIETVRKLWRGESITVPGGSGHLVEVQTLPRPVQAELPVWITSAGSPETFRLAGEAGVNVLTHLLGQDLKQLAAKIAIYREAWHQHGHDVQGNTGHVTLMIHTFIGTDLETVRETVRQPFRTYLRSSVDLLQGLARSLGLDISANTFHEDDMQALLDHAFERYFESSGLMGTVDSCLPMIENLKAIGVDELACLIDFGVAVEDVLASLQHLEALKERSNGVVGTRTEIVGTGLAPVRVPTNQSTQATRVTSLPAQLLEYGVSHLQCTPSLMNIVLMDPLAPSALKGLSHLLLGGEVLALSLVKQIQRLSTAKLHNMYGPTETTIWSTAAVIKPGAEQISLGGPIANTQIYLLDAHLQPVPIGVPGEVYIGGEGLVHGYLHRPDLTAERFLPNPFVVVGGRLYRTGDLARYHDGTLEYLGRIDQQVKLRGFRIELGEIETTLRTHPAVQEAVVVLREEGQNKSEAESLQPLPARKALIAYVVKAQADESPTPVWAGQASALQKYLYEQLPDYMVPASIVFLEHMPLLPNGKVDRKALPAPPTSSGDGLTFVAPRTPVEHCLAAIWRQVLGLQVPVGIHDNFFALGGDSILSLQIIAQARQAGLRQLTLKQLFQYQTIAQLALVVGPLEQTHQLEEGEQGEVTGPVPLTPIQHWFFALEQPVPQHYNQSVLLQVPARWDLRHLQQITDAWLRQHDALRLRYQYTEAGWQQRIVSVAEAGTVTVERVDLTKRETSEQAGAIEDVANRVQASLDLQRGPLLRVVLFELGHGQPARLLIVIHHLAVDGVSWRVLLADMQMAMTQLRKGQLLTLPAKTVSFQRWAKHLQEMAQTSLVQEERAYWLRTVQVPTIPLPLDFPTGSQMALWERTVSVTLTAEETQLLLRDAPRASHSHIQELLLVALLRALARWIGTQTIRLDLEGHGREELLNETLDVSRTAGWFTSLYPVLFTLPQDGEGREVVEASSVPTISTWIKTIKEQMRSVPHKGIGYGLLRYCSHQSETVGTGSSSVLDPELQEQLASASPSQVMFNYLGQFDQALGSTFETSEALQALPDPSGTVISLQNQMSHILSVNGLVIDGQLHLHWTYSEQLHRQTTIEALAQDALQVLRDLLAHCLSPSVGGLTPSDFPLVSLNQSTLDRLLAERQSLIEDLYPLTPTQQGMLFHTLYEPASGSYIDQTVCTFHDLNHQHLVDACQQVVAQHTILRTAFVWQHLEEPLQLVESHVDLPITALDWSGRTTEQQEHDLSLFLQEDRLRGFDLSQAPLLRLTFIRITEAQTLVVWSLHQILIDIWSLGELLSDIFACYLARIQNETPQLPPRRLYRDYLVWLSEQRNQRFRAVEMELPSTHDSTGPDGEEEAYWRSYLAGFRSPTPLLIDHDTTEKGLAPQTAKHYSTEILSIPAVTHIHFQEATRRYQVTLNTLVLGAWALVLSRYSGEQDVVFGTVVAGRPAQLEGVESIIGLFINTLPTRVQVRAEGRIQDWLLQLQQQQVEHRQHEQSALVQIQQWSEVPRNHVRRTRGLLFESLLIFVNASLEAKLRELGHLLNIEAVQVHSQTNYPLTIRIVSEKELFLRIDYDNQRFEAVTIRRVLLHLRTVLEQLTDQPDLRLADISFQSAHVGAVASKCPQESGPIGTQGRDKPQPLREEEHERLRAFAGGASPSARTEAVQRQAQAAPIHSATDPTEKNGASGFVPSVGIHTLFEAQIERTPDAIAAVYEEGMLTYGELNSRANQLACYLQTRGIGIEVRVGVLLERSLWLPIVLLGILKAGGTYVPLDPAWPPARLTLVAQDADLTVLVTSEQQNKYLEIGDVLLLEQLWRSIKEGDDRNPDVLIADNNLAYIVYTSGSTGRPKGVLSTHTGVVNYLRFVTHTYQLTSDMVVLQLPPLSFDASVRDIFATLIVGGRLVLVKEQETRDFRSLITRLQQHKVTALLSTVPSFLHTLLDTADSIHEICSPVQLVLVSGEPLSLELVDHARRVFGADLRVINQYGPTEATMTSTYYEVDTALGEKANFDAKYSHIGKPLTNMQAYVLDQHLRLVPVGTIGEVYLAGPGLARGYLAQPDTTAEKFIPNPFVTTPLQAGTRMYRTGDLVSLRPDGTLEYHRRRDQQVKIRGNRVELAEIHVALEEYPGVSQAIVVAQEMEQTMDMQLVAYIVPKPGQTPGASELRPFLQERLPEYMLPTHFIPLETIPLTPNGKLDRRALPLPRAIVSQVEAITECELTPLQAQVAAIWADMLHQPHVNIHDDFFELGGHSLLALQLINRIRTTFAVDLPLDSLFDTPTVEQMALVIEDMQNEALAHIKDSQLAQLLDEV